MKTNKSRRSHGSRSYHPYRHTHQQAIGRPRPDHIVPGLREQDRLQQQQLQQQGILAQSSFGSAAGSAAAAAAGVAAVDGGVINMPSYADQMQAAFLDYHRQRAEFEQQQHQLLQKLYHTYPDVSVAQAPAQVQPHAQEQPPKGPQGAAGLAFQRPQFGSNGLQPSGSPRAAARTGPLPGMGAAGDFYSTQQHMGFMQQQHQDVLREQQQLVAHQFATSQMAPTTRQSFGMAVPMSSVLAAPSFPSSSGFSGGDLNHSF